MGFSDITNFLQISDRIASSGQPDDHEFKYIKAAGYKLVINLAMPNSENAIPEEGNIVTAHRMTYVHIPVPFNAPDKGHLNQFIGIMQTYADQNIWVHCVMNYRVSAFLYQYYRQAKNLSSEEARKFMWPAWEPDEVWRRFMALEK